MPAALDLERRNFRDLQVCHRELQSEIKWSNQLKKRDWTYDQITYTIKNGKRFPAPNNVNPGNKAVRYEYNGRYVVRDEVTKSILQVSGPNFRRPIMP